MAEPRFKYLTRSYLEALGFITSSAPVVFEGHIYEIETPERVTYKLIGPAT